jgi:hypothetical protein
MDVDKANGSFEIIFEHEPDYLRAEIRGPQDNYHVTTAYWERIADELTRTGYDRLLVVEMLEGNIDIQEAFRAVRDRERSRFDGIRIAFFDLRKDHNPTNSYCAAAAAHVGYELEVFTNLHEAKKWLTADADTDH